MIEQEICLPRKLTNQLLHLAQASPQQEICGLIGANAFGRPVSCYPVANSAEHPQNRYCMEPGQQIAAMKAMRDKQETLFAIFHSHPETPAIPSATDIAQANYPQTLYLIISMGTKGVLELRAFNIDGSTVKERRLCLVEN